MSADWQLTLRDSFSGPATAIIAKAKALDKAIAGIGGSKGASGGGAAERAARGAEKAADRAIKAAQRTVAAEEKAAARRVAIAEKLAKRQEVIAEKAAKRQEEIAEKAREAHFKQGLGGLKSLFTGGGAGGLLEMGAEAGGPAAMVAVAALDIAKEAATKAAELVKRGSEMVIEATTFHDMTVGAFKNMLGSAEAGEEAFEKGIALSEKLGSTQPAMMQKMKLFMAAGMNAAQTEKAVTAIENASVGISARAGMAVQRALITTQTKGFLDNRGLTALRMAGVNVQEIYTGIAAKLGKTTKEVELLVRKGKVSAQVANEVIENVVNKKSGGMAEARGQSVPGLLAALKIEIYDKLFADTSGTVLNPVKAFLSKGLDALHGPAGEGLHSALMGFFGATFKAIFGAFEGPDGAAKIATVMRAVTKAIEIATVAMKALGIVISGIVAIVSGDVFPMMLDDIGRVAGLDNKELSETHKWLSEIDKAGALPGGKGMLWDLLDLTDKMINPLRQIYELLKLITGFGKSAEKKAVAAPAGQLIERAGDVRTKAEAAALKGHKGITMSMASAGASPGEKAAETAFAPAEAVKPEMHAVGESLMEGVAAGIDAGGTIAQAAMTRQMDGLASVANRRIERGSPSRLFARIGASMSQGVAVGIQNDNSGRAAVRTMVSPPSRGGSFTGGGMGGGGGVGGSRTMHVDLTGMQIHSAATDSKQVAQDVSRELDSYFEDILTELAG